jgi:hypothetical protein
MFRSLSSLTAPLFLSVVLLLLASCNDSRPIIAQAYVAPATIHLHSDLATKSATVAELKHGDHLDIIDVQRRLMRVRTDKGVEGWLDSAQLLSPEQWDQLKQRRQQEASLPSEGTATAYEQLNVHIDPERQSPSFAVIPEGGSVTILGHKLTPKVSTSPRAPTLVVSRPQALSRKQRKEQQQTRVNASRLPPKPAPPKPPANWQQLSSERIDGGSDNGDSDHDQAKGAPKPAAPAKPDSKPVVLENWSLIRTKSNEIGWVLTRNLLMSIPDDVAQYAEGKLITAFFDLGLVNDEVKGPKHNWLWTTAAHTLPNDFDSWRVFLWNYHRHRFETSYRERDLEGYFPVTVDPPDAGSPLRTFHIITKDDDGKMRRRSYSFDGHRVHLTGTEDYAASKSGNSEAPVLNANDLASKVKQPNWFKRQWANIKHRLGGN